MEVDKGALRVSIYESSLLTFGAEEEEAGAGVGLLSAAIAGLSGTL